MKKNVLPITILLVVSILLIAVNFWWIQNNLSHLTPPWDQSAYIYMSLHEYEALSHGNIREFIDIVLKQAPNLAPLFPVMTTPFFMLFGLNVNTAYLANSPYLFILLLSVFFITERLTGRKTAILSVFTVATFPAVIAFSRDYLFEFPLAGIIALSYLFLLKSEEFQKKNYSILFGICAGLALLTKTMGIVFFVLPFLYGIYILIRTKAARKNIAYACVTFLIISALYYLPNMKDIFSYLFYYGVGQGAKDYNVGVSDLMSLRYWTIYMQHITERGISPLYLIVFIASFVAFLLIGKKKPAKDYIFIWLWFLVGYFLLSIPLNKGGERYALPIMAPIAILLSAHIGRISFKPLKYGLIASIIIAGMVNYIYQTKSDHCVYKEMAYKDTLFLCTVNIPCRMQEEAGLFYDKKWDAVPLIDYMDSMNKNDSKPVQVLVGVDHNFLNVNTMRLYATLHRLKGDITSEFQFDSVAYKRSDEQTIKQLLGKSDFIITKSGYQGPDFSNTNNSVLKDLLKNRTPLTEFIMSDGSIVYIYNRSR